MSLFSRVGAAVREFRSNSLDNPATPISAAAAWMIDIFSGGPTAAGVAVNEHTAMQLDTVYSCINVITSDVASLPLKVYRKTDTGKRPAEDLDLYDLLAVQPNPEMTAPVFLSTWLGSALLTGNGYAEIQWTENRRQPIALWPRNPLKVKPKRAAGGEQLTNGTLAFKGALIYELTDTGSTRLVDAKDMLHLKGFSQDGLVGLSPIHAARQTIGTAIAAGKFGGGWFGRGSRPSGLLTGPVNTDATKRAQERQSWEAANSGDNQGRTAVMPSGWTWTPIGISPKEAQFIEIQQYTSARIAGLYRVPPHMIGDTSRLSNSNHESQSIEYVKYTLRPWLGRIEAEIHAKLMPRIGRSANTLTVRFDVSELIRGDFASQMTGFATGKQWGFTNTNEIKQALGEDTIGELGEEYFMPLNMVPMSQIGKVEPVQGGDVDPDAPPGEGDAIPAGNGGQNQRMLLDRIGQAYGGLFRDAHGRLLNRSKRDADAVHQVFGPVLDAIAAEAVRQAEQIFRIKPGGDLGQERVLRDVRKAIEKRAADWTPATAQADVDAELARTVRSITLGIAREAGTTLALAA